MNFEHTEDRRMLADALERYLRERYGFSERDRVAWSPAGMSREHWQRLSEIGALGALFPEYAGGLGGTGFDVAVVFESLGKRLVVEPFLGALMVGRALLHAGGAAHSAWLDQLIEGSLVAAFAHDEPDAYDQLTRVATRAEPCGEGWVLRGAKVVVHQAEQAGAFLVSARTKGEGDDPQGIALFIVPRDAAGLTLRGYPLIDGGRAAEMVLQDIRVGADALVGSPVQGADLLEHATGWGVLALCAEAVGAMDVARRETLDYLRTRQQFGVPIGSFQALQHRMADLLLEIEQARSAVINAAAAMGAGRQARERALSAAKYSIGRIGTQVAEETIQLHGGIGMTWELPIAHYAKRLVMIDHQLGDEDHHLARYIALGSQAAA